VTPVVTYRAELSRVPPPAPYGARHSTTAARPLPEERAGRRRQAAAPAPAGTVSRVATAR